jgi:uncharacterized protein YndB with AHSA1/START domain
MSTTTPAVSMEMELTRLIRAPRSLVWQAWTEVDKLQQWWGPRHFTNPRCEIDLRVGGAIRIDMRAPDGIVFPMSGEYEQIVPPERLVFLTSALDEQGEPIFTNRNTVIFREVDGATEISIHTRVIDAKAAAWQYLKGMREGWSSSLDKLEAFTENQ